MKNLFLEKISSGIKPVGSFSQLCSPYSRECMALSGMDYVVIDMEHGPAQLDDAAEGIKAAELRGMTPFVRLPSLSRDAVLRLLDLGAKGLIAPCVQGVEDVKKLIEYSKYPPLGQRGLAFGRGSGWGSEEWIKDLGSYLSVSNRQQLLIPQCETVGCLRELEEILAFESVAGIFIGPFDLSAAMGIPGRLDSEEFSQAVEHIKSCCKKAGKFCIIYVNTPQEAAAQLNAGMDSVAVGMDSSLYISMYRSLLSDIRGRLSEQK